MKTVITSLWATLIFTRLIALPADMVYVPGGTFTMGRTSVTEMNDERPAHIVTVSPFMMGKYEVTQKEYLDVMLNWSSTPYTVSLEVGETYPVYYVNWYSTIKYCNLRSMDECLTPVYTISGTTNPAIWGEVPNSRDPAWDATICDWSADGYRLPTEAEWEYAARGASNDPDFIYSGSDNIDSVAWCEDNDSPGVIKQVGMKACNSLGCYDMSGNLSEWCWDWYGKYSIRPENNPSGASNGSYRVYRGGSWFGGYTQCRVTSRDGAAPEVFDGYVGFRLCRTVP